MLIKTLLYTGVRVAVAELVALRLDDVDLDANCAQVAVLGRRGEVACPAGRPAACAELVFTGRSPRRGGEGGRNARRVVLS